MTRVSSSTTHISIWQRLIFALGIGFFLPQALCEAIIKGNFTQGGLVIGSLAERSDVLQDDEKLDITKTGFYLLGFGRDASREVVVTIKPTKGKTRITTYQIKKRNYNTQRIEGLSTHQVSPTSKKDLTRINKEINQIKRARALLIQEEYFKSGFIWPAKGLISGVYGSQRILNGEPRRPHYGIDIAGKSGDLIVAPADGIVTLVQIDNFFSGQTLILDHGYRLSSSFLHLSEINVSEGQVVKKGEVIGRMGSTGRSTGPHLDWRINLRNHRIDPQLLVPPM